MKIQFKIHIDRRSTYNYIKCLRQEIQGKKSGLRHIRKEAVKTREKHIRNLEKQLSHVVFKKIN